MPDEKQIIKDFGRNLREMRYARGIDPQQIYEQVGIGSTSLRRLEYGGPSQRMSFITICKLIALYECQDEALFSPTAQKPTA